MPESYLGRRFRHLKQTQNPDGGWGYFEGKRSWLEPTAYSLLALHEQAGTPAWEKGWSLIRSWQRDDGAWRPSAQVEDAHWSTALAVTLHCIRGVYDAQFRKGVDWLLDSSGEEARLMSRIAAYFSGESPTGHSLEFRGWPWRPDTSSWIEPTAHSLVALKKAAPQISGHLLKRRVVLGEGMILRRRCEDGGWNYGSKAALGIDLPSYPETTALALLGLQGSPDAELGPALARARNLYNEPQSPMAKGLLKLSLLVYGNTFPEEPSSDAGRDVLVTALEVITSSPGTHPLLRPVGAA